MTLCIVYRTIDQTRQSYTTAAGDIHMDALLVMSFVHSSPLPPPRP